jgi:hypothetical protein
MLPRWPPTRRCQSGIDSVAALRVSCVGSFPFARIEKISKSPSRLEANAIRRPSGDQAVLRSSPSSGVRMRAPPPRELITQMSFVPSRLLVKASRWPSGAHAFVTW